MQAESSVLEAQAKALQDSLESARANNSSLSGQLAEARQAVESLRHGSDTLRQERDKLQRQNHELSEKLQAQVRLCCSWHDRISQNVPGHAFAHLCYHSFYPAMPRHARQWH